MTRMFAHGVLEREFERSLAEDENASPCRANRAAASRALAESREAIAKISETSPRRIAGMTVSTAILAGRAQSPF
jgi:hypothetical protein